MPQGLLPNPVLAGINDPPAPLNENTPANTLIGPTTNPCSEVALPMQTESVPVRGAEPVWPFHAGAVQPPTVVIPADPIGRDMTGRMVYADLEGRITAVNTNVNANNRQYDRAAIESIRTQLNAGLAPYIGQPVDQSTMERVAETLRSLQQRQAPNGTVIHVDSVSQQGDRINVDMSVRPPPSVERIVIQPQLNQPAAVPHCIICGSWDCDHLRPAREADLPLEPSLFEEPKCVKCGLRDCVGDCPHEAQHGAYGYPGYQTARHQRNDLGADSTHMYRRSVDGGLEPYRPEPAIAIDGGSPRAFSMGDALVARMREEMAARSYERVVLPQMAAQQRERILEEQRYGGTAFHRIGYPATQMTTQAEVAAMRRTASEIAADDSRSRAFIESIHQNIRESANSVLEEGLRNGFAPPSTSAVEQPTGDPMRPLP